MVASKQFFEQRATADLRDADRRGSLRTRMVAS